MRKHIIALLLVVSPIFITAQTFNFDKEGNTEGWRFGNCTVVVEEGTFIMEAEGRNPNIRRNRIKTENAQYMHIVLKNNTNEVEILKFNFKTDDAQTKFVFADITNKDEDFKTYTLHLGSNSDWTGLKNVSLRFSGYNVSGSIEIDKIVFDNNSSIE